MHPPEVMLGVFGRELTHLMGGGRAKIQLAKYQTCQGVVSKGGKERFCGVVKEALSGDERICYLRNTFEKLSKALY